MKAKKYLLIGIILGALIGWALGFLRLPYVEKNFSFLLGFIACLAVISLGLILWFVWNKNSLLIRLIGKDPTTQVPKDATRTYSLIWILVSGFIILGGLVSSFMIFKQKEWLKAQIKDQNKRIVQQSEFMESVRKSSLVTLMTTVLDKVENELRNSPTRTLSDETIAKIAALNYSFKPYRYLEGDSLSEQKLSPERGQLLLALSLMNIDSSSFGKIKLRVPFSGADLSEADLRDIDLSGANLSGAYLKDADFRGANLNGANLSYSNLRGADLNGVNLSGVDMRRADLSWAELNGVDLKLANLNGADLSNAQLRKADLQGATFQWAELGGAMLNEANLIGVDLEGTAFIRANLSKANLTEANLRRVNLTEANLIGAELSKADVGESWLEKFNEWRITGAEAIRKNYKVVNNPPPSKWKYPKCILEKN